VNVMRPIRTIGELERAGLIDADQAVALEAVAERYAVALTPTVTRLIDAENPVDPIARQFVPDAAELLVTPRSGPIRSAIKRIARSRVSSTAIPTVCF